MTLDGTMAITFRYSIEFGLSLRSNNLVDLWRYLCTNAGHVT